MNFKMIEKIKRNRRKRCNSVHTKSHETEFKKKPKRRSSITNRHRYKPLTGKKIKVDADKIITRSNKKFKKLQKLHKTVQIAREAALKAKSEISRVERFL